MCTKPMAKMIATKDLMATALSARSSSKLRVMAGFELVGEAEDKRVYCY